MSRNASTELLVCYDIRNERRLQRVHRCMRGWGMPIQYSVFYCRLSPRARNRMENDLRRLINEDTDDVRVYGIKSLSGIQFVGDRALSGGLELYTEGFADYRLSEG